ncbi:MAG: HypC/HybG/HupF family hydrogenase formation chaperone [Candidatus Eisenbacteria bacterium]|nr:HypC/HybG/HupF family hydrogenase formation chaperone [Candidatus Eisenbacteria bacterium]
MCLAVPGLVREVDGTRAKVDFGGITREVELSLLPDTAVDDYVLVHAGYAIEKVDRESALETMRLFREMAEAADRGRSEPDGTDV